jgi:cardiolipin synthase
MGADGTATGANGAVETLVHAWSVWKALWPHVLAVAVLAISVFTSVHAILTKRDTRSTIGWVGLIWFSPIVGAIAYALFGVNRIRSRALQLRLGRRAVSHRLAAAVATPARLDAAVGRDGEGLRSLVDVVDRITRQGLLDGNRIEPLDGGDEAYPSMLAAIDGATRSIGLSSYIFDNDATGREFAAALGRAVARGVAVRVLVDGIGAHYTRPPILDALAATGVPAREFLPTSVPVFLAYANLRNHRKIMVVDGTLGFTGGLNIREGCRLSRTPAHPVRDMHFALSGPVVTQLLEVFVEDWAFAADERLDADRAWHPVTAPAGTVLARGIRFGPDDDDLGRIKLVIAGALAAARHSVRVMTPYFLPDDTICRSLDVAALRGVEVDIVIPGENNLSLVQWAGTALLWQVLGHGCRVWQSPPPFDHTKLLVVDGAWVMFGSGNWDERSMRLNFEFNVEAHDRELAGRLDAHVAATISRSRQVTLDEVDGRSLPIRLRDGIARLFAPYL